MNRMVLSAVALAGTMVSGQAVAQTQTGYGSAIIETLRNCPFNSPGVACDGRGSGQGIAARRDDGGEGKSAAVTLAPGGGNSAIGAVTFTGFGFPQMRASVTAGAAQRMATSLYAFQSYTYTGTTALSLELYADFHINNSSTDNQNGSMPGGAIASTSFAIWRTADFYRFAESDYSGGTTGFSTASSLYNQGYIFGSMDCLGLEDGSPTPLAINYQSQMLTGGEAHIGVSQDACVNANPLDEALTINPGDSFVVAVMAQVIANRNGFVDAMGTFNIGFSENMSQADVANFQANTSFATGAVPEPATWAMMMVGFGAIGGAMRYRRKGVRLAFAG